MSTTNFRPAARAQGRKLRCSWCVAAVLALLPLVADAQQPTSQQQNAIRQSCRSDFQSSCAGVPAGGSEALQCLKQSYGKVSPSCQKALAPVMGNTAASASGAAPASPTAGVPAKSVAAPAAAAAASSPAVPSNAQGGAMGSGQPASMREEVMLTRELCGPEFRSYCGNVQLGGGRAMQCLEANAAYLSPKCKAALAEIRARR